MAAGGGGSAGAILDSITAEQKQALNIGGGLLEQMLVEHGEPSDHREQGCHATKTSGDPSHMAQRVPVTPSAATVPTCSC